MLIITRKKNQKIMVGDVEITIAELGRNRVTFWINAPKAVHIDTKRGKHEKVAKLGPQKS